MPDSSVQLDTLPNISGTYPHDETITSHAITNTTMDSVQAQPIAAQSVQSSEPVLAATQVSTVDTTPSIQTPIPAHSSTSAPMPSAVPSDRPAQSLIHTDSVAIGPSTDEQIIVPNDVIAEAVCVITLLLTTGARHPYRLDEKYLTKRNVSVPGLTESGKKDPFSISVYTLKELILREWREEWDARPSSPSSIRLIHFGRLLDDKAPLKDCRFNADSPNVVHMTVKPQDVVDDEDAGKGASRDKSNSERTPGCRCIVM